MTFLYDLAISLLSRDLPIAEEIKARLRERYNVFLYSDEQKELVFRDTDNLFSRVFKHESRAILILYREEWGKTRWTGIEEAAIKERKLEHNSSLDFLGMLTLDGASPPEWYNKTYIFQPYVPAQLDLIITSIEQIIQRRGGVAKLKSPQERLMDRKLTNEQKKQHEIKLSGEGPAKFQQESLSLMQKLGELAENLNQIGDLQFGIQAQGHRHDPNIRIFVRSITLYVYTEHNYQDRYLSVAQLDYRRDDSDRAVTRRYFSVDVEGDNWFWLEPKTGTRYSFEEMPEYLMNELITWQDQAQTSPSGYHTYRK